MKSGLFAFILFSALVHAIIIGVKSDWIFNIDDSHEQGSSSLKIELSDKKNTKQATPKAQAEDTPSQKPATPNPSTSQKKTISQKKSIVNKKSVAPAKIKTPEKLSIKTSRKSLTETSKTTQKKEITHNTKNNKSNHDEKIKALLNNELSKHFYYPKAAQRKNRQGRVLLGFTISPLGGIENIHVNQSSGFTILDNAAIKALKKIDANKDLANELNGDSSEHTLPITYKLTH